MKEENSSFFFLFKIVGCKQIKCKCLLAADCPMGHYHLFHHFFPEGYFLKK